MAHKQPLCEQIAARHNLVEPPLDRIAPWASADFVFHQTYDVLSITTKIRMAGFHDTVATQEQLVAHLRAYQEARILPAYDAS